MNRYTCFYQGKQIEVSAESTLKAQMQAAHSWQVLPHRRHMITVFLAEKNGQTVIHDGAELAGA